jgi:hypothetical protein
MAAEGRPGCAGGHPLRIKRNHERDGQQIDPASLRGPPAEAGSPGNPRSGSQLARTARAPLARRPHASQPQRLSIPAPRAHSNPVSREDLRRRGRVLPRSPGRWSDPHHPLERPAERSPGVVTDICGDGGDRASRRTGARPRPIRHCWRTAAGLSDDGRQAP